MMTESEDVLAAEEVVLLVEEDEVAEPAGAN
jgi:hypothetical protein